ncbi:MAG: sugar transferase [Clostridia bacterium]|nr:sugar transferase [Clostridia bacterium]
MNLTEVKSSGQTQDQTENPVWDFNPDLPKRNKFLMGVYLFLKRTVDIIASFLGLILLSPVFLAIAIAIKADDGGKVFYSHKRIGKNGKQIKIFKYRSMVKNADRLAENLTPEQLKQYETEYKVDDDPRITRVGSFLRKSSLDELPQLLNILFGTLSIVGPRPVVERELLMYGKAKDKFLSVKPGLTGYWQAYARNTVSYTNGERQKMELYYVDHCSLWFDIKIFFKTIVSVIRRTGAS